MDKNKNFPINKTKRKIGYLLLDLRYEKIQYS